MGWVHSTGFGPSPLPFVEIESHVRCMGMEWEPWEFDAARNVSAAYGIGCMSEEHLDPALWSVYKGLLPPLVLPSGETEAKLATLAQEA